ncbi:MAG: Xaa-Pro peptidase family protein [Oscillospiraceae bacterium]|jgi:Xaa-Pro aminopeptidase|nr:Xaa-Pro peptidase family protein [Oscillospiraceae bacterium]
MNNIAKLQKIVAESEFGAFYITSDVNRLYATGFPGSAGAALISGDGAWFMTDSRYFEAARDALPDIPVLLTDRENTYMKLVNDLCAEHNLRKLAIEDSYITYAEYRERRGKLTAELVDGTPDIMRLRASKSEAELDAMIAAQRLAEEAFNLLVGAIDPGITEKRLAAQLVSNMLYLGADGTSFDTIVVSGTRSSLPHGVPTDAQLGRGFVTIDFGVKLNGYVSDTTRTIMLGEPTDEERRVYDTVLEAQLAGIAAAKAGVTGAAVDAAARDVIKNAGYGEFFGHSFGHSLGLEVHESPNASPTNDKPLPVGAVISAEPGIYLPGRFGVRIEDALWLTESGSVNITRLPKELLTIKW